MQHRREHSWKAALIVAMFAITSLFPARTLGQAIGSSQASGLDLVLLVDVSGSMRLKPDGQPGSDPNLKRWAAVQLVLSMLTFEDRVLVIPFNDQVPAIYRFPTGQVANLPGDLGNRLLKTQSARSILLPNINQFLGGGGYPDDGGTSIFGAMRTASQWLATTKPEGNRRVVMLLTDGEETELPKQNLQYYRNLISGANDYRDLRTELSAWGATGDREPTPIYTMALGSGASTDVLSLISVLTRGSSSKINDDRMIVETFRDVLWTLKGSWVQKVDLSKTGPILQPLQGLVDVGFLGYQVQGDQRVTVPLPGITPNSFAFTPAVVNERPSIENRSGGAYSYFFTGRASAGDQKPFGPIDTKVNHLSLDWGGGGGPNDYLYIAARTPHPLFEIVAPLNEERFQRFEGVRAKVRFKAGGELFDPKDFDLTVRLEQVNPSANTSPAVRKVPLEWFPGLVLFEADLPLRDLPNLDQRFNRFNLIIEAIGKKRPDRSNPLADKKLVIGSRTVFVENQLTLADSEPVRLSRSKRSQTLAIRTVNLNIKGNIDVRLKLNPPTGGKRPFEVGAITASQDGLRPRPVDPAGIPLTLRDGKADVVLQLDDAHFPADGNYLGGRFTITADPSIGLVEKSIPLELSIDTITLGMEPGSQTLTAENGPVFSGPIRIGETIEGKPVPQGAGLKEVTVEVIPSLNSLKPSRFADDELWLVRADQKSSTSGPQKLVIAPGSEFRVGFNPKSNDKRIGQHSYLVEASASKDVVKAKCDLSLKISPPKLQLAGNNSPSWQISPGNRRKFGLGISFDRPVPGEWHLYFKPAELERGHAVFRKEDGSKDPSPIELIYPTPESTYLYDGKGRGEVEFDAIIPEDHAYGIYEVPGTLEGPKMEPFPVTLTLVVDDLNLEWFDPPRKAWVPIDRQKLPVVKLRRSFHREFGLSLRVGTMLNRPLDRADLAMEIFGPFQSDDQADQLAADQTPLTLKSDEPVSKNQITMKVQFPKVTSALKETDYRCGAIIQSPKLALKPLRFEFFASFED